MRCKKCGANNEEVNSYCINCGNKLVNSPKESGVVLNILYETSFRQRNIS